MIFNLDILSKISFTEACLNAVDKAPFFIVNTTTESLESWQWTHLGQYPQNFLFSSKQGVKEIVGVSA